MMENDSRRRQNRATRPAARPCRYPHRAVARRSRKSQGLATAKMALCITVTPGFQMRLAARSATDASRGLI